MEDIDAVVQDWVTGARVAKEAGFAGRQLHGAHGFFLSQFLSPHTNRRTDDYGGSPEKRLALLKRLVKKDSGDMPEAILPFRQIELSRHMDVGQGLSTDEGLEQVRWLVECGDIDFLEISGDNAENKTSKLHSRYFASVSARTLLT